MRAVARNHVYWPDLDNDIEIHVQSCRECQMTRPEMSEVPLFSWSVPQKPWSRIHVDYCGPFQGKNWLIIIDATSKWMEVFPMERTSTTKTITLLRETFARFGLPSMIVSDNGAQFTSLEFSEFCKTNNIKHVTGAPYHPKTNGLAERGVRTFKQRMRAGINTKDINIRLQKFLMSYRSTPQRTTQRSPAAIMFGRELQTRLHLLRPDFDSTVDRALTKQKLDHDNGKSFRNFVKGEKVWVSNTTEKGYTEGIIVKKTGDVSYQVEVDGLIKRKHADQMKKRVTKDP
ncbi:Hypothetical protein NTJ_01466 [Nesidiocoris tenuis]|nr:Hypothetical protein NTJ_01466 [Nesidiocoris tenuis]